MTPSPAIQPLYMKSVEDLSDKEVGVVYVAGLPSASERMFALTDLASKSPDEMRQAILDRQRAAIEADEAIRDAQADRPRM